MVTFRGKPGLEWLVAALGLLGGIALIISGAQYGLSSPSGVGPGTFPAAAGSFLALASALWLINLIRPLPAEPVEANTTLVLEAALGGELTHRVSEVETATEGHLELDSHPIPAEPTENVEPDRNGTIRVVVVVASIVVAAALLQVIGFVIVMTLQLTAILITAGKQPWLKSIAVALVASLVTRYIFGELLGVALPTSSIPLLSNWGI